MSCPRAAGNSNKGALRAHKNSLYKNKGGVLGVVSPPMGVSVAPSALNHGFPRKIDSRFNQLFEI